MLSKNLKSQLSFTDIPTILTSLGCEQIKAHPNYTTATRGQASDNPCGVIVYHDNLSALMPTTDEFSSYPVKDIITVVQVLHHCSYPEALRYLGLLLNIDSDGETKANPPIIDWLEAISSPTPLTRTPKELPPKTLDHYFPYLHERWQSENITAQTAARFQIGYDIATDSITIPLFDEAGSLSGVQCRSLSPDAPHKYYYLYPCTKQDILYGFYQNYHAIHAQNEIILFEGAKSVLQAASVGIYNTAALLGKTLSSRQIDILNREGVDIILALDNDVPLRSLENLASQINNPISFNRVFALRDELGFYLGEKQSPADNLEMLKNYRRFLFAL